MARTRNDALAELAEQDDIVARMLDRWEEQTHRLEVRDSVDERWERGSTAKMLLQYLAVRDAAKEDVVRRLREVGEADLAGRLEGDGPRRRAAIARFDEAARGMQAISMNQPQVDLAILDLMSILRGEFQVERDAIPAAEAALGPNGERGLPGARSVRMRADTHPSATPSRLERVFLVKALRAFFNSMRSTPSGGTRPQLDAGREHTPGPRGS